MPRWKMLAGKYHVGGKVYKAGDEFVATTDQVRHMRDMLQPLDALEEYQDASDRDVPRQKLMAVHLGHGKWNVVNRDTDKAVNDHPLDKREAQQLVDKLIKEGEARQFPKTAEKLSMIELEPESSVQQEPEPEPESMQEPEPEEEKPEHVRAKGAPPKKGAGNTRVVEGKRVVHTGRRAKLG